jgi:hypothetical protein
MTHDAPGKSPTGMGCRRSRRERADAEATDATRVVDAGPIRSVHLSDVDKA